MTLQIIPSGVSDITTIHRLLDEAIEFQRRRQYVGWDGYDEEFIARDVSNGNVFKVTMKEETVAVFSVYDSDKLIWRERDKGNALYLHRIVLDQRFTGLKVFKEILAWSVARATERKLSFVRMDTWANNEKLINYYQSYGFQFIENYTTPDTLELPLQHRNLNLALLQFAIRENDLADA